MGLLSWIIFGLIAGAIARLLVPSGRGGRDLGCIGTVLLGVIGSLIGGTVASLIAGDGLSIQPSGLIGSFVGAVIVLVIWRAVDSRSSKSRPRPPRPG